MNVLGAILAVVALIVGFGLLFSLPVMWLWDWLMPEIFGLKEITWLQAWGINILCGILFNKNRVTTKD